MIFCPPDHFTKASKNDMMWLFAATEKESIMAKKTIQDVDVQNKTVLMRVDFQCAAR